MRDRGGPACTPSVISAVSGNGAAGVCDGCAAPVPVAALTIPAPSRADPARAARLEITLGSLCPPHPQPPRMGVNL
jgi:hypothetical protein